MKAKKAPKKTQQKTQKRAPKKIPKKTPKKAPAKKAGKKTPNKAPAKKKAGKTIAAAAGADLKCKYCRKPGHKKSECRKRMHDEKVAKETAKVGRYRLLLVTLMLRQAVPSNFQAAAALSGVLDMELWSATGDPAQFVFNTQDHEEVRVRNPMAFIDSLQIPVILFAEPVGMDQFSRAFHKEAILAGKSCELKIVPGDHNTPRSKKTVDYVVCRDSALLGWQVKT